jgi:hypothetical protein
MLLGGCARILPEGGGRYWVQQTFSSRWKLVSCGGYVLCCECVVLVWRRVVGFATGDATEGTWRSACCTSSPSCVKVQFSQLKSKHYIQIRFLRAYPLKWSVFNRFFFKLRIIKTSLNTPRHNPEDKIMNTQTYFGRNLRTYLPYLL